MALTDKLTAIAEAIRTRTKTEEKLTLDKMAEDILAMNADDFLISLIGRTADGVFSNNTILSVGQYGLAGTNFNSVSFENAVELKDHAFYGCDYLTEVNLPKVQTVLAYTFATCQLLSDITLPAATTFSDHVFYSCPNLQRVNAPEVVTLGMYAFGSARKLTDVYLPKAKTFGRLVFSACTGLTVLNLPSAISLSRDTLTGASNITEIHFSAINQATIEKNSYYSTLWGLGAGAATVYFDL